MATLTETFTNIANSIRLKTETTDKITPENMPAMIEGITTGGNVAELTITSNGTYRAPEGIDGYTPVIVNVPQDGSPSPEAFVITGDCQYRFATDGWNWFIKQYSNQITTKTISNASRMFNESRRLENIPFDINLSTSTSGVSLEYMFYNCNKLSQIPKITGKVSSTSHIFSGCKSLIRISNEAIEGIDWSYIDGLNSQFTGNMSYMFNDCCNLREIPVDLISHGNPNPYTSYAIYYSAFRFCRSLDEIIDLPNLYTKATFTNNVFYDTFNGCNRLKRLTFKMPEGKPYIVNWKSQIIDLSNDVGYTSNDAQMKLDTVFTDETRIYNEATYQALKDNPDAWVHGGYTGGEIYSRYNKTSAIETINSLPDTSAYLATAGGTNTIKFKGKCGSGTDGGAINTLTEEEIAVATSRGWTVSFV